MDAISKIGLGTVQFGTDYGISNESGQTSKEEVAKILDFAAKSGIKLLDTALAYGKSEAVLGQQNLEAFGVVSKFMPSEEFGSIRSQYKQSLDKLNVTKLYGYLSHRPSSLLENPSDWDAVLRLKSENKIEKIGFSLNSVEELEALLQKGLTPDIIQVPFNYFDNRFQNHMISLKEEGCEIHTRSTFLQGLFFMNPLELNSFFDEVKPMIKKLQDDTDFLAGALLNYSIHKAFIDKVIVGVETKEQLVQNLNALENSEVLDTNEVEISDKILNPSQWKK